MSDELNGGLGEMYDHYEDEEWWEDRKKISGGKSLSLTKTIAMYRQRYDINKIRKTGEEIQCPVCGKRMIKRSYQHQFCHSGHKDKFWNLVDDNRRARAQERNGK